MDRKEAVLRTVKGLKTAYIPYHFDLTMKMTDRLGEHYGLSRDDVEDFIGNHFLYLSYNGPEGEENGYRSNAENKVYRDEFGVSWDVSGNYDIGDWGLIDTAVKDLDFSGYTFPDGRKGDRFTEAVTLMEKYPGRLNTMQIRGPFTMGWNMTGMEDILVGMATEDSAVDYLFDNLTNYIVDIIDTLPEGVDAVRVLDDWGTQTGLIFSKEMWGKYIYPRFKVIGDAIRKKDLVFMHHSCGNTEELFQSFIDLGIDIYDPMQPEAIDLAGIKKKYGRYITLCGGLGSQSTIPLGTPEDVVKEASDTKALMEKGGRYILGPAGSIPTDAPVENVATLVDFCKCYAEKA